MIAEAREPLERAERQAVEQASAAYAGQSDDVWLLFRERRYAEAGELLGKLSASPEYNLAAEPMQADRAAAELLAQFWAAVERGLAARKGKSFVVGGAAGDIVDLKDGEVTLRMGNVEFTRRVHQLTIPQAVACAGLKDDPYSMGMLGVLLLAERREPRELDKALEALDAAADTPGLEVFRDRLVTRKLYVTEAAAKAAWQPLAACLDEFMDEQLAGKARPMLEKFQADHASTEFHKQLAPEIATLRERIAGALGGPRFTLRVVTRTADHPQAGSSNIGVDVLLNGYEPFRRRLAKPAQHGFRRGAMDTFDITYPCPMPSIQGIKLEAQGNDPWKCKYIVFQLFEGGKKSEAYRFPVNKVFSSVDAHLKRGATTSMWFPFLPKLQ
jgi:hypothetical protein